MHPNERRNGQSCHVVIHDVYGDNEMGNRPISCQDVALQIFYASIFYPFANFRQLANEIVVLVAVVHFLELGSQHDNEYCVKHS